MTSPPAIRRAGDIVMVMGMPGAGKSTSTLAQALLADGYHRLNRDEVGGTLRSLSTRRSRTKRCSSPATRSAP